MCSIRLVLSIFAFIVFGGCMQPYSASRSLSSTWHVVPRTPSERAYQLGTGHVAGILRHYDREIQERRGNPGDTLNRFFEAVRSAQTFLGRDGVRGACGFAGVVRQEVTRWNTNYVRDQLADYQSRATIYFDDDVEAICASVGHPSRTASTSESYMRRAPARTTTYQLCWQNGVSIPCPPLFPEFQPRR